MNKDSTLYIKNKAKLRRAHSNIDAFIQEVYDKPEGNWFVSTINIRRPGIYYFKVNSILQIDKNSLERIMDVICVYSDRVDGSPLQEITPFSHILIVPTEGADIVLGRPVSRPSVIDKLEEIITKYIAEIT